LRSSPRDRSRKRRHGGDEKANQLSEGVQRWGSKGETLADVLKRKKSGEIAQYIAYKVLEEAPQQAIVIGSTLAGMPTASLAYMGISSAAQAQSEGEGSSASPAAVTANAVINGTLEAALEQTPALLGKWSKALESSFGKQGKMQILKNVAKTIGASIIQEGPVEEGSTEFLQSLAAKFTGVNPNAMTGVGNRMLEASVIGGAMGAGMTSPAAIGAGYYQNGQNVAPLDINQGSEYLARYGTPPLGGGGPSGPSGPSAPVAPPVPVPGNTLDVVPPGSFQQAQPVASIPTSPVQSMVPQEPTGNETPPPPPPAPGQTSPSPSALAPTNSPQTKDAIRSGAAKVSDDELLKFPPQDRERAKSLAEMIYAEDVQRFNSEMDTYNEWKDVLGRGIKASADVSGEIRTLPLHLRNNKFQFGQTHDLIAEDALSRGLIQRPEDLFDAIKNIKKPTAPFHPDSNLSEARQIIEGEREADAETSIEPTWEGTYETGMEPSFFESKSKYTAKEQGDLFAAPKENVGQTYDRLIVQARKQGLSVPEAVKYAKRTLAAQGRGVEAAQGGQQAAQMEMGVPGGVEGFGRGQKGQGSLFEERAKYGTQNDLGFYSQLQRTITEKMPNSAPVSMVKALIDPSKGNVKAEDVEWSGINEFLQGKEKVSKTELLDFLKSNEVQIKEVVKGNDGSDEEIKKLELKIDRIRSRFQISGYQIENNAGWTHIIKNGEMQSVDSLPENLRSDVGEFRSAQDDIARLERNSGKETKFKSYQLPGGSNYREVLLTLPGTVKGETSNRIIEATIKRANKMDIDWDKLSTAEREKLYNKMANEMGGEKPRFVSSHFDEPNILAHVRMNDRTTTDGKKVLFLEEVQSDWHQQGREKGYAAQGKTKDVGQLAGIEKDGYWEIVNNDGQFITNVYFSDAKTENEAITEARRRLANNESARTDIRLPGVPNAPFKKTWHELALKRMLRYAVDNGYDGIAWTTGEQQAERYDLSKQLSEVEATKIGPKSFNIIARNNVTRGGVGRKIVEQIFDSEELPDVVGKDLANKIIADGGGKYSGLDLKVGGEGMKGFYDQMISSFLNKYTKKWGGRVSDKLISFVPTEKYDIRNTGSRWQLVTRTTGERVSNSPLFNSGNDAENWILKNSQTAVHSIEITPSMRESVTQGQSLFEKKSPYGAGQTQMEMNLGSEVSNEKPSDLPNAGRANPYGITNQAPMELQYKKEGTLTFAGKTISSSDDVAFAFKALKNQAVEHLYAVGTKGGELVSVELISIGSIDQALAPPFEIVGLLRDRGADGFWIIHNHPSGDPKPSNEDHNLFRLLMRGFNRVGLKFNGGVVIDDTRYSYVDPSSIGEHKEFVYPGMEGKKTADVDVLKKYAQWNGPKERPILVNGANVVYDLVKGSQISKDSMSVLLLNNKNRLMGHATIPINAGVDAIVDLASKWRSPNAIISIQADNGLPRGKFSDWPRQLGDLGIRLMDVLTINDNSYSSWREKGTFPSVSVGESPAEYSVREKNGEQAVVLPNGGYVPLATMSKFKRFMREWFTTERGVGKTIDRLNEERIGKIMETAFDAPLTGKALLSYLKENPSEDLRQGIFDALTGKREIESLPEEIVPTVKKMRADVDALSRAVADGASPNDNMRMVIERNLGQYLGRYYKLFERKRFRPSPEVIERAKAKMRELNPKTLGKASEEEMDGIIENILSKGDVTFHRGDRRVDIPQNHFIKRKDIPKEIRELYGEITDPTWAYLKTMSDQAVVAHNATFLGQIANVEGALKDKPTRTHFKLIPDTARWGSVRGKYTTPEINDFLIEAIDPVDSGLFRLVEKFVVNPFKWTKTVASLPSHPRNMLGNTMFSVLGSNAITNPMNIPYYWKALRVIMGREGKYRETWKELVRARVADTQYWGSEMPKMMAQMISDPTDWPNRILETAKWPIEKLGNLYNNEDLVYRVSSFLKYRDNGMTVNQAAAEVDKWFTNYARLPKGVKVARRMGVFGPFLSFKANTARILATAAREAADGIKKGNPAPAMRLAFVLSFISALAALSKKIFDVDDDKMKKLQDLGPVYKRNSNPIYYKTSDGKTKAFDLGYIWPTGEFQKSVKAALVGDVQSFVDSIDLFQHPLFDAYSVLFNNYDTRSRRGVSNPNDPLPMQTADKMANILSQIYVPASSPIPSLPALMKGRIEPGLFSGYQMKTIYDAYHGVQDRFGRTRKMPEELRAFATGIRTWEINPEDIVKSYVFRKKGEMNEAKRDIMRRVSANNLTQQERNVAAQLRDLGINTGNEKAQDFMKARGVSDSDSRRRIIGVNVEIENFKRRQEKIARDVKDATELLKEINKGD
jgi:DNA repair protein RadC